MDKLKFSPQASIITLYTTLEHKRKGRLLTVLDTGATYVMIPRRIAEEIGLIPTSNTERVKLTTASGVELVSLMRIKKIKVLGKVAVNIPVVIHDLPPESAVDGLLGLSFLRNFLLKIDFKKGTLELR